MQRLLRRLRGHGERDGGAVLVLAVLFVLIVGVVGGAIASLATTNLAVTSVLGGDQTQSYAAQSAVQVAIGSVRNMTTTGSVPGYVGSDGMTMVACPTTTVTIPSAGAQSSSQTITVMCAFGQLPQAYERQIVFAACPSTTSCLTQNAYQPGPGSAAIVVATTSFYDLKAGCTGVTTPGCFAPGTAVDVTNWYVAKSNS